MIANTLLVAFAALPALIAGAALPQTFPDNWDENSEDIVGGVAASAGDLPFIVSVQLSGSHFCGGSLVNANTIVSAAHCYFGRTGSSWSIRAGSLNRGSGGVTSRVSSIKIHPSYNDDNSDNDIAILKLATPIQTSSTISYATLAAAGSDPAAGTTTSVYGWGNTAESGSSPALLRKVDVPVISRATCRSNYSVEKYEITDRMFCAGLAQGGKDSCQGDSGGPIVSSSKQLLGIVSFGAGCARAGKPGVYSNIGALSSFVTSNL